MITDIQYPPTTKLVSSTDLRFHWKEIKDFLRKSNQPVLVLERSTPTAVILPYKQVISANKTANDLTSLSRLAITGGPKDLSAKFDDYLYGTL